MLDYLSDVRIPPIVYVTVIPVVTVLVIRSIIGRGNLTQARYSKSAEMGLRTGLIIASLYSFVIYVLFALSIFATPTAEGYDSFGLRPTLDLATLVITAPCGIAIVGTFGIAPAFFLGYSSGLAISLILTFAKINSTRQAILTGSLITLCVALAGNALLMVGQANFIGSLSSSSYWIILGAPSLIYIAWGGWMGYFVYRHILTTPQSPSTTQIGAG